MIIRAMCMRQIKGLNATDLNEKPHLVRIFADGTVCGAYGNLLEHLEEILDVIKGILKT